MEMLRKVMAKNFPKDGRIYAHSTWLTQKLL
jgi:hypothetical protein